MRLLLTVVVSALCMAPSVMYSADATGGVCTASKRQNVSSSGAYEGCYKSSSFSFVADGVDTDLTNFCRSDECFELYKQLWKIDGVSCLSFKNVLVLNLTSILKAERCVGNRLVEFLETQSDSASGSDSASRSESKSESESTTHSESNYTSEVVVDPVPVALSPTNSSGLSNADESNSKDGSKYGSTSILAPDSGMKSGTLIGIVGSVVATGDFVSAWMEKLFFLRTSRKSNPHCQGQPSGRFLLEPYRDTTAVLGLSVPTTSVSPSTRSLRAGLARSRPRQCRRPLDPFELGALGPRPRQCHLSIRPRNGSLDDSAGDAGGRPHRRLASTSLRFNSDHEIFRTHHIHTRGSRLSGVAQAHN